jgi:hypothetical protein
MPKTAKSCGATAHNLNSLIEMNEPVFKLDYYDLSNPAHEKQYRTEVYVFASHYSGEVNYQAEMASIRKRANLGFYRSSDADELATTLLENWPEDFADEDRVSDQARAEVIQLEECRDALKDIDAEWMDETEDEDE